MEKSLDLSTPHNKKRKGKPSFFFFADERQHPEKYEQTMNK